MNRTTVKYLALLLPALFLSVVVVGWALVDLYILFVVRPKDPTFPTITAEFRMLDRGFVYLIGLFNGLLGGHFFLCGGGRADRPS